MNKNEDKQCVSDSGADKVISDKPSSDNTASTQAAAIESGQLSRARAQLGLSLADLSAETRIPKRHLAALENHQVDRLPAQLFVIGYLRTCAERLGLNLDKLLTEYGVAETVVRDATASASTADTVLAGDTAHSVLSAGPGMAVRPTIWRLTAIAMLPLLFIIVFAWAYSMQNNTATQQADSKTISEVEVLPAPLGQLASVALSQPVADTEDKTAFEDTVKEQGDVEALKNTIRVVDTVDTDDSVSMIVEAPQTVESNAYVTNAATNSNLASGPGAAAMVAQHQSQDRLVIKVSEDSWVHITDAAGSRLFRDLARAGKKIDVSGKLPFNLHLGNAPGLALELNGSPFAITDYRDDNSARFVMSRR